ncbi:MAG: D-alanyl-D-alanine carboxypeptidase [Rhodobiaceae bacterium]|nr:D-alanyl-D-alanine carboxypeptidase [Rhodobiaceae bacterium]
MRLSIRGFSRRSLAGAAFVFCVVLGMSASPQAAHADNKYAAIVVDHQTGKVLFSRYADSPRYPASLTKVMTLYLLFDELEAGRAKLSDRITISAHAASMPPSKLGLKPGSTIRVEDAIRALVTKSANDIAAAVGEHIAGSESAFAERMTRKARALGMRRTSFRNASGLPDSKQVTTARDLVTLSRAMMTNHPRYYRYFSTRTFRYAGRAYGNHNRLLGVVKGVDGIKTGYTRASGFNLITSVSRDNRHLVAVVMGGKTGKSRNQHMTSLINQYLPQAIARKEPPRVPPGVMVAAADIPLPERRPELGDVVEVAESDPIGAALAMSDTAANDNDNEDDAPRPVKTRSFVVASAGATLPLPPVAPPASSDRNPVQSEAIGEGDVTPQDQAETVEIPTGWAIQIGAAESKDDALSLIAKAKAKAPGATASRVAFTEETVKNGTTYIRARFAGYNSKDEAQAACAVMKKRGFGCFPISL